MQTPAYYPDIFKAENHGGGGLWRLDLHDIMVSSTVFFKLIIMHRRIVRDGTA